MNKILPKVFKNSFINKTSQNLFNSRGNSLDVPWVKATTYGSNSWNFFQMKVNITTSLPGLNPTKFLKAVKTYIS